MTEVTDTRKIPVQLTHAPAPDKRQPVSTYRLQLGPQFTFDDATQIIPYLKTLGITGRLLFSDPSGRSRFHSRV